LGLGAFRLVQPHFGLGAFRLVQPHFGVGWQLPFAVPSNATELPQTLIGIVIGIEI
jgi:hypothetical protein